MEVNISDEQFDTLIESYKNLEEARQKFKESLDTIKVQRKLKDNQEILVPLTGSMYAPGFLQDSNKFLIDVGTQYLIEKDADGAEDYFLRKLKFIDSQLSKFREIMAAGKRVSGTPSSPAPSTSSFVQAGTSQQATTSKPSVVARPAI